MVMHSREVPDAMPDELKPGIKRVTTHVVTEQIAATHIGAGKVMVLSTPAMIGLMEWAATEAVQPYLGEGQTTVGIHVDVRHLAATPLGMKVNISAELLNVEKRVLTFRVVAEDEVEVVGEGTHRRAIIDVARFQNRLSTKSAGTRGSRDRPL
jgi:predicted thioesterase